MKKINARFNHGRWIWDCPVCNAGNTIQPDQSMAFCGECYLGKFAMKEAVVNNVIVRGYDKEKQDVAKREAYRDNRVYKISFPKDYKEIVKFLRSRLTEHQSWEPGETLEDLKEENNNHPDLAYTKKEVKSKKAVKPDKIVKELPVLDDKTLRRIY